MMKRKRKEGEKGEKGGKREERREKRREKINKWRKNYDKFCYLRGEKRYIFPQPVRYLLGEKNISSEGGGGRICFIGKIYTPAL